MSDISLKNIINLEWPENYLYLKDRILAVKTIEDLTLIKKDVKKIVKESQSSSTSIDSSILIDEAKDVADDLIIIDMDNFKDNKLIKVFDEIVTGAENSSFDEDFCKKVLLLNNKYKKFMPDVEALDSKKQPLAAQIASYAATIDNINKSNNSIPKEQRTKLSDMKQSLAIEREVYLKEEQKLDKILATYSRAMNDIVFEFLEKGSNITVVADNKDYDFLKTLLKKIKKKEAKYLAE